jgi:hypothetical protein
LSQRKAKSTLAYIQAFLLKVFKNLLYLQFSGLIGLSSLMPGHEKDLS